MVNMDIDGFDDLIWYFEKIGGDVEKVEFVVLKVGGEIIVEWQCGYVN